MENTDHSLQINKVGPIAWMWSALRTGSLRAWALCVLAVGLALRLVLWLAYSPVAYGDTASYRRLAGQIMQGWDAYDGTRTPGYPLFLALAGPDRQVWLVQMALGLLSTLLVFYIAWQISRRPWFAGLAGLAHTLNLQQLLFEPDILSETLTTCLITAAFAGAALWLGRPDMRSVWLAAVISLLATLALMVRPLFIYLPIWLLLFLVLAAVPGGRSYSRLAHYGIAFLLPAAIIAGGWVRFIHSQYGDWSLTTMTGYHLIQHTGVFFELVPEEHAALRDTFLEYRARQIAEHGSPANTIWRAIPAMQKVSGKSFYDLSRALAGISVRLILEHPELYLKNVLKGWLYFWLVPVYWRAEALHWPALSQPLAAIIWFQRMGLFGANLFFLATSILALVWGPVRRALRIPALLWCIAGAVWAASVVQTLVDHGDNPRFLVPMQTLVVLWCLWAAWRGLSERQQWTKRT